MSIQDNFKTIQTELKISGATLIAVSKMQPEDRIEASLATGHRIYGENRVQEAQTRWNERRETYPDLELHLIGPLQSNKAADAVALFDVIHTVDREKIARILADEMKKQDRILPVFIQVNTGDEDQKAGVSLSELESLYIYATKECGLNVIGLMCIPPLNEPPAMHFALLKKKAEALGLKNLSMGMSGDYPKALELGATHIRIGSALFGERSL